MDKHDRPYQCQHPSCAKLQGFTYSGGLLRHEREVHGKHGGPKSQLVCPYEDCKRHTGKGFTRKENLNEHVRRVHKETQSQGHLLKREAGDAMLDDAETPASRISDAIDPDMDPQSPAHKRRRYAPGLEERNGSEDVEGLRQEVERLRSENAAKDERLQILETNLNTLSRAMDQLQQQQGQGQEQA